MNIDNVGLIGKVSVSYLVYVEVKALIANNKDYVCVLKGGGEESVK